MSECKFMPSGSTTLNQCILTNKDGGKEFPNVKYSELIYSVLEAETKEEKISAIQDLLQDVPDETIFGGHFECGYVRKASCTHPGSLKNYELSIEQIDFLKEYSLETLSTLISDCKDKLNELPLFSEEFDKLYWETIDLENALHILTSPFK